MTDHANELRRYSRKIGHPAGDVPSVMLAAAEEIERLAAMLEEANSDALEQARLNGIGGEREAALMAKLEAAEKSDAESLAMYRKARDERDALRAALQHEADYVEAAKAEIEALRAKIEAMEKEREELHALVAAVKKQAHFEYVLRVKKEKECTQLRAENAGLVDDMNLLRDNNTSLRAKIAEMERQKPVGTLHDDGYFVWRERPHPHQGNYAGWKMALYALPGAKGE